MTLQVVGELEQWIGIGLAGDPRAETAMAELFLQGIDRN